MAVSASMRRIAALLLRPQAQIPPPDQHVYGGCLIGDFGEVLRRLRALQPIKQPL